MINERGFATQERVEQYAKEIANLQAAKEVDEVTLQRIRQQLKEQREMLRRQQEHIEAKVTELKTLGELATSLGTLATSEQKAINKRISDIEQMTMAQLREFEDRITKETEEEVQRLTDLVDSGKIETSDNLTYLMDRLDRLDKLGNTHDQKLEKALDNLQSSLEKKIQLNATAIEDLKLEVIDEKKRTQGWKAELKGYATTDEFQSIETKQNQ